MSITARFDGKVFVPEGPVEAEVGDLYQIEKISIRPASASESSRPLMDLVRAMGELPVNGDRSPDGALPKKDSHLDILEGLDELPEDPDWPEDGAMQVDHYLYGTPKRP